MITGEMHAYQLYDRMGRITLWMNNRKLDDSYLKKSERDEKIKK